MRLVRGDIFEISDEDPLAGAVEGGTDARPLLTDAVQATGTGQARAEDGLDSNGAPDERPCSSAPLRVVALALVLTAAAVLERIGHALLRLLAFYALRLTSDDPSRHAVLGFDEAWVLLADSAGRALLDRISRLGRAQNVTPLFATQVLGDASELESLAGAVFCFGVETDTEAERALRLLRLDPDDERLRRQLTSFRRGRCLFRDYAGRVGPIQVELVDPELLAALDTTPGPYAARREERVEGGVAA